jgi:hypothetical protein
MSQRTFRLRAAAVSHVPLPLFAGAVMLKKREKAVRKYLNLKGWMEGDMPKYLILKVVRYQILERKGLTGGHVIVVVNIFSKNCSTWNNFLDTVYHVCLLVDVEFSPVE